MRCQLNSKIWIIGIFCALPLKLNAGEVILSRTTPGANVAFEPGDGVRITVYPDTTTIPSGVYHIDSDGKIVLPLVGELRIAGMTPSTLAEYVKQQYVSFQKIPNASIRPLIRVSTAGGFHTAGLFYVDPDLSLWDVVRLSGGPVREDGLEHIHWMRGDSVYAESILPHLISGESMSRIGFRSGDALVTTDRPLRTAGDVFIGTILPVLSFAVTSAFTAVTVYQLMRE